MVFRLYSLPLKQIITTSLLNLENFYVWGYTLSELDFSSNINLKRLDISCENGPLSILDLSNNTNLLNISIEYFNNLSSLDLRNGNNVLLNNVNLNDLNLLMCVDVDDPVYSTNNWTQIDPWTSFSSNLAQLWLYRLISDKL